MYMRFFEREKITFKMLPASLFLVYFFKRFRSFNSVNIGSVGQRAAKLQSTNFQNPMGVKLGLTGLSGAGPRGRLFLETSNFESW